ncbi:hypothetical protein ACQ4PT_018538 [Festuca glaucescens]
MQAADFRKSGRRVDQVMAAYTDATLALLSPLACKCDRAIKTLRLSFYLREPYMSSIGHAVGDIVKTGETEYLEFGIYAEVNRPSEAQLALFGQRFMSFFGACPAAFSWLTKLTLKNLEFRDSDVNNLVNTCNNLQLLSLRSCGLVQMLYLDSLEVDEVISDCNPRVDAWDSSLISKVKKKDRISPGVFGKLQLKEKYRDTQQGGLFGGLLTAEQFTASNLPRDYDQSKKRKIGALLYGLCSEFEESMAKFVQGIGNLEQCTTAGSTTRANVVPKAKPQRPRKRQRTSHEEEAALQDDTDDSANSDDDEADNLYYLNTRSKRGSTSSGDKRKKKDDADVLPTTTMEDASLPDLCRIEKKSKLPDTPPTEKHVVLEEREAIAPGPVCTSPTVHATSAANKATTSTFGATSPLEHATPALQVPVVPSNRVQFSPPTRQTCPPPSPHTAPRGSLSQDEVYNLINKSIAPPDMPQHMQRSKSAETKWKEQSNYKMKLPRTRSGSELLEGYCNAPTFNLGPEFDLPENQNAVTCASADEDYDALEGIDPAEIERVCIAAEQARRPVHEQQRTEPNSLSPNSFQTPIKEAENVATESISGGTASSTVPHQFQRRIIKLPPCKKSPFVNVDSTKQFLCTAEVNKLYAMIIQYAGRNTRQQNSDDKSPHIVNFGGYHVTPKELANSMKPGGWLHSTVMEVGIQAITKNMTPSSNKVIMPLRIGTWMQNLDFNRPEMKELFSYERRLDKKDMVMIPVCEPLNKKAKNEPLVHHYWLLTVNMRDKRYQVLDSWRTFNDKALRETYKKIRTTLSILWEENYKKSKVQIDDFMLQEIAVPKQTNK